MVDCASQSVVEAGQLAEEGETLDEGSSVCFAPETVQFCRELWTVALLSGRNMTLDIVPPLLHNMKLLSSSYSRKCLYVAWKVEQCLLLGVETARAESSLDLDG